MGVPNLADLLPLLACPCDRHGRLRQESAGLVSECCGRNFRLENGIPVLLLAESEDA